MTREEAIKKVKGYLTDYLPTDDYKEIEEIIEALKQESILDKVKDKIKADVQDGIYPFLDGEPIIEIKEVLQIIDKYKADKEQEDGNDNRDR